MPALAKTLLAAGTCTAVAGAHADASRFLHPFSSPEGARTRNRAPVLADSLAFPPSLRRSAFPHDHVVNAAAAVGAAGSLGVLAGVYRVRLNRCRCSKAERAEVKQGGAFAMHCRRCLKRTNKGVFVSFLTLASVRRAPPWGWRTARTPSGRRWSRARVGSTPTSRR